MLRLIGGILIMGGALGLGVRYRQEAFRKVEIDRTLLLVLNLLKSEVNYGVSALPECCLHVSKRLAGKDESESGMKDALKNIFDRMETENGKVFGEIFREETMKAFSQMPFDERGIDIFVKFTENYGFADKNAQLRLMDLSVEMLEERIDDLNEKNSERGRMAVRLGFLGGILLVIMLI